MSDPTKKPVKMYRRGAIAVSIWRKEVNTADGEKVFYAATPSRAYTDDDGKTFKYSDSFDCDDLPVAAALLNLAFAWIVTQQTK